MELHPDKKQDNQQDNTVLLTSSNAKEIYLGVTPFLPITYYLWLLVSALLVTCNISLPTSSLVSISIIYYVSGYKLLYLTRQ